MHRTAKDIMVKEYETIRTEAPVKEAARAIYNSEPRATGYKPFGIMVTDDLGRLVGSISMYDILYHIRPAFMNYELGKPSLWDGEIEAHIDELDNLTVDQIMRTPVVTAAPDDNLVVVIDRMIRASARRLPIVENDQIVGIVHFSDVFCALCDGWLKI